MGFKKLLLITLFEVCFLPAGILQAQENSSSSREQNKAITVEEYVLFLNECATKDPYHLFEAKENSISRLGTVGEYQYSFLPEESQKPVTLLSTLDASRYGHWKSHQSNNTESLQEVTEESKEYLSGDEVTPISNNHSSCLKMDCLLKTNLCDFCLLRQEEQIFQASEDIEEKTLIGLTFLLLVAGGLKAQNEVQFQHHQAEETSPNSTIPAKYRLNTEGKWEKQHPEEEHWTATNDFDKKIIIRKPHPNRNTVWDIFCNHYTRQNEINKKIEQEKDRHAKQKQSISSLSEPEQSLHLLKEEIRHQDILLILQKAQDYQNRLNRLATESHCRETAIKRTIVLANHPNRLELLAEEIGRNEDQLALFQQEHQQMINKLTALNTRLEIEFSPEEQREQVTLIEALPYLNKAIEKCMTSREKSRALIQDLPNYYQEDIKEALSVIKAIVLFILEAKMPAIQFYHAFLKKFPLHERKIKYLNQTASSFAMAASLLRNQHDNHQVIQKYIRSTELFQQAAATFDHHQEKATYLNNTGSSFFKATEEEQKTNPNQLVIEKYLRAAELFQQATATFDHHQQKAKLLNEAGLGFFRAAVEAQKANPNQKVTTRHIRSAELFQQAAITSDHNQGKAKFLSSAGVSFVMAAIVQKLLRKQQVIQKYIRSAEFFQQAAAISDNNQEKAAFLNNAGFNSFQAAEEEQKENPNPHVIQKYVKAANLCEQAVTSWNDHQEKAKCLKNAAFNLSKAAAEEQKKNPNPHVIQKYVKAANLCEQAVTSWNDHPEKAEYLDNAAFNLYQAAKKEQELYPDQEVIEGHLKAANLCEQAAATWDTAPRQENASAYILSLFMGLKAIMESYLY